MSKHTPGPWVAVGFWVEHPEDGRPDICSCNPSDLGQQGRSTEEICANANLIAAAPDLLEALQDAVMYLRPLVPDEILAPHLAAISKATGEQL